MTQELIWGLLGLSLLSTLPIWLAAISNHQHETRQSQKRLIVRQTLHAESEIFRLTNQALNQIDGLTNQEQEP